MKLFIFSGEERPVVPGTLGEVEILEGTDISQKIDFFYNHIECFDFLESSGDGDSLEKVLNKVGEKGLIKFQGIDINEAVYKIKNGTMTPKEFSDKIIKGKSRCTSLHEIVTKISNANTFDVTFAGISGIYYILEARRK